MKTDTTTLIKALRILAQDIQSGDGVANAAIAEAADRLEELHEQQQPKPVDENTPKDRSLLMWYPRYGWQESEHHSCEGYFPVNLGFLGEQITHWLEMPPEPTGG